MGFKFVAPVNAFTSAQCTEDGIEGFIQLYRQKANSHCPRHQGV